MQQWNFGVQRQLGKSRVLEIAYVGSKGTHLIDSRNINQPQPSVNQQNPGPNPYFSEIDIIESQANSTYHSLQARLQQRLWQGLSLLASYTYAKSIDDASGFFNTTGDPNFPQNSYDLSAERGRSDFDIRQRFTLSYAYDLPVFKGHRWMGGWQSFGVLTFQTGQPFTVALLPDNDNTNTGISQLGFGANDRPNVAGNPRLSNPTPAGVVQHGGVRDPALRAVWHFCLARGGKVYAVWQAKTQKIARYESHGNLPRLTTRRRAEFCWCCSCRS